MPPRSHTVTITTLQTDIPVQHSDLEAVKEALGTWLKNAKGCAYHNWIHNHRSDDNPDYAEQDYPLIQLRCHKGRLRLWGMQEGSAVLKELMLAEMFRGFHYRGTPFRIVAEQTGTQEHRLAWAGGKKQEAYELNYFVAFKPENFRQWQGLPGAGPRLERLQQLLVNNLAMFCKAAGFALDKEKLKLTTGWVWNTTWVSIKEHKVLAFTLTYECNLLLPDGIALGRQTKLGYGWQTVREKKEG